MASHKGTLAYMAPEIAAGQTFNSTVDIYSLGIMMYQLLNNRRLPFLDDTFKFSDIESAVEKRLSGAMLPCPENADEELGKIICKMCAHSPKERYVSPEECLQALKNYLNHDNSQAATGKKRKFPVLCAILLIAVVSGAIVAGILFFKNSSDSNIVAGISAGNVNTSGAIAEDAEWLYYRFALPYSNKYIF